jgi:chemotaxis response regulator CheB
VVCVVLRGEVEIRIIEAIMRERPRPVLALVGAADPQELGSDATRHGALAVVRHVSRTPAMPLRAALTGPVARRVVGIAASAGGTGAVAELLGGLPEGFSACIAVVQHLPIGFAEHFADYLRARCAFPVELVAARAEARPGRVLLACDDRHLAAVSENELAALDEPPRRGHRPSADVLFESLAALHGVHSAGVILSGMGDDGADGLRAMREAGAWTAAQDERTSAVYGMPRAAAELGGAGVVLPLPAIAPALAAAVAGRRL